MMVRGRVAPVFKLCIVASLALLILPMLGAWLPDSSGVALAEPMADKPVLPSGGGQGNGKPASDKPALDKPALDKPAPVGQGQQADGKNAGPTPTPPVMSAPIANTTVNSTLAVAESLNVNLDQCANLTSPCTWQNGSLNGENSAFPEGGVVPFRLAIEGLPSQPKHVIHVNYDFTASGHKAYDFLATYNASENARVCDPPGAVSSLCPSILSGALTPATTVFPSDPFVADGLPVSGAEKRYESTGKTRNLTIYGGTILSVSTPSHTGDTAGNSSVDLVVEFTATGQAALLLWGGHLADSGYWDQAKPGGTADGAAMVSGAPWHMRTQGLDGSGNRNQDRSIQSSAIIQSAPTPTTTVPPSAPPPTPTATPMPGNPGTAQNPPPAPANPAPNPPAAPSNPPPASDSSGTPTAAAVPHSAASEQPPVRGTSIPVRPGWPGTFRLQLPNAGGIPDSLLLTALGAGLTMISAGLAIRRR